MTAIVRNIRSAAFPTTIPTGKFGLFSGITRYRVA